MVSQEKFLELTRDLTQLIDEQYDNLNYKECVYLLKGLVKSLDEARLKSVWITVMDFDAGSVRTYHLDHLPGDPERWLYDNTNYDCNCMYYMITYDEPKFIKEE